MNIKIINTFFVLITLLSCQETNDDQITILNQGLLSTQSLQNEISEPSDESLTLFSAKKENEVEGLKIEVEYHSSAIKFKQEYGNLDSSNYEQFQEYLNLEFYTFKLKYKEERDVLKSDDLKLKYTAAVHYLTDKIKGDLGIETIDDKIVNPELVVFERTFGVKPYILVNMVFDKRKVKDAKRFVYFDKLFGKGFIKIDFTSIEENIL